MKIDMLGVQVVQETDAHGSAQITELNEVELALIGGGCGEIVWA